jgi:hypothetical protein
MIYTARSPEEIKRWIDVMEKESIKAKRLKKQGRLTLVVPIDHIINLYDYVAASLALAVHIEVGEDDTGSIITHDQAPTIWVGKI